MFCKNTDVPYTDLGGGIKRKILSYNEKMMAVEVHFEKGAVGAMHSHPHTQISYVIDGEFRATICGVERVIVEGDTYITPPDVPHGVACLQQGAILDVFTPMREDFVK